MSVFSRIRKRLFRPRRFRAAETATYLREKGISRIAAMKINIGGGEFELPPHLVEAGLMPLIDVVQVQFHRLSQDSPARRDAIGTQLSATHRRSWCYPFVWEEWVRQQRAIAVAVVVIGGGRMQMSGTAKR